MHIVTGGAGFIGSVMVWKLNQMGIDNVWIVDDLGEDEKWRNLQGLRFTEIFSPDDFMEEILQNGGMLDGTESVIHLGACSSTTERNADYLLANNYRFSRSLTEAALPRQVRLLIASSAAVYGAGEQGYADGADNLAVLRPLNMYGQSKLMFDQWAARTGALRRLAALRFFNVYGPNEYHKGDMASMVYRSYGPVAAGEKMCLFKSYREGYRDGEQMRDFVYVKDIADAMWWFLENPQANGIYNVGTGETATWNKLAASLFAAAGREPAIEYIDMPEEIRGQYQYHTQADITRLRAAGCDVTFRSVSEGVADYVKNHLAAANPYITATATAADAPAGAEQEQG